VYSALRGAAIRLLRLPAGPPDPPPGGRVVRTFNASRRYLHYCLLTIWVAAGILFIVAGVMAVLAAVEGKGWIIGSAVFAFLGVLEAFTGYVATRLEYEMRFYILTDRSLRIREGVLFLRESTLTFANVQNLRIKRGPLQQVFGISDVLVDTAGGAGGTKDVEGQAMKQGHRGTIKGIENPAEVRDLVMDLLRKYRDAGLGDPDDHRHAAAPNEDEGERLREILAEVKALRLALTR
jgi:membrane protein YdbS with pleckstrin-like domain